MARRRFRLHLTAAIVGLLGWAVVLLVALAASKLRPAADDYCHASQGLGGYFESLGLWYLTWIGDLFQMSMMALLVGQTLDHLPLSLASAVPFLLTALAVLGVVSILVFRAITASRRTKLLALFASAPVVLVAWWAFWWVPAIADNDPYGPLQLAASATTHWQTVNIAYVFVPMVLIGGWVLLSLRRARRVWAKAAGLIVIGFLAGTGGLVFGLAAVSFVILYWAGSSWWEKRIDRPRTLETAGFVAAALIGLLVAYLAPGAQSRSAGLAAVRPLQSVSPRSIFAWIFPQGVFDWIAEVWQAGSVVVVMGSMAVALLLAILGIAVKPSRLLVAAGLLLGFSFLIAVVSRAGDGFAYPAFWHSVMPRAVIFVALVLVGIAAGTWLLTRPSRWVGLVVVLAVAIAAAVAVGSIFAMTLEIQARFETWQGGPASLIGIGDIEIEWVATCWDKWAAARDLPYRG